MQQGNNGADGEQPGNNREVNADHGPQALARGKRVGHFAEADGAAGVADHVKGLEKTHAPGVALVVHAWDQGEADGGNGIGGDKDHQRHAHAPQEQEDQRLVYVPAHGGLLPAEPGRIQGEQHQ